jgi:hypothetical protein
VRWEVTWHIWKRSGYSFLVGSLKERDHFEDLGAARIILRRILKKRVWRAWTGPIWLLDSFG